MSQDGRKHGCGRCIWASGETYNGEWHDDLMHGTGTLTAPSGSRYQVGTQGQTHEQMHEQTGSLSWGRQGSRVHLHHPSHQPRKGDSSHSGRAL